MNFDDIYPLGLGVMRHNENKTINWLVAYAATQGINYYEACTFYNDNRCEEYLANALAFLPRDKYFLCDKLPISDLRHNNISIDKLFEEQLKKCNTSYFDNYLIQALDRDNYKLLETKGVLEFFGKKKQEGVVHNLGFSFHDTPDVLREILDMYNWDVVQLQLNYYDWYLGEAKSLYQLVKERNLPIIVMGACKGGLLVKGLPQQSQKRMKQYGINPADLCYKFLTSLSNVKVILSGAETLEIFEDNLSFFKTNNFGLTQFEKDQILLNIEDYKKSNCIQCTNCRYCINKCPKRIPINEIFYNYNTYLRTGNKASRDWLYDNFKSKYGIYACQKCGACERACPQHLPIQQLFDKNIFPMRL